MLVSEIDQMGVRGVRLRLRERLGDVRSLCKVLVFFIVTVVLHMKRYIIEVIKFFVSVFMLWFIILFENQQPRLRHLDNMELSLS